MLNSEIDQLVEEALKYKKYKKKYEHYNKLSKLKCIGHLFQKKRDKYFSKYALSLSCLETDYIPKTKTGDISFDTITI